MEAFLRNTFQNGTPSADANYGKMQDLPRCKTGHHAPVLAHQHALPPLPPVPPAVAAVGSLAAAAAVPAAAPPSSAAESAAQVPGQGRQGCIMLTISPRRFHSSQRGGRVGCKITLGPYDLQYVPFVNMPNTRSNALPLQSSQLLLEMQQPPSAHADLGSSRSPLGALGSTKHYKTLSFCSDYRLQATQYGSG